jgi:hypothetical protein
MTKGEEIEPARMVAAEELLKWADAIQPDTKAEDVFSQTVQTGGSEELRAEQVFVITTDRGGTDKSVSSFELAWEPEKTEAHHCGYFIHVYNEKMEELFSDHVDGVLFEKADQNSVKIPVKGRPITGVNVIHIKLVPDFSTGDLKTSFSGISAVGI